MDRFVVLKGVQGWGDRLQCLLQAIWYAKATGRLLVLDWRDPDWCHDTSIPIKHWFTLQDVPTLELESFLTIWQRHGTQLSLMPATWANRVGDAAFSDWIYDDGYCLPDNNAVIGTILAGKAGDLDADVVVLPSIGHRTFRFSDATHLQLADWLQERITGFAADLGLAADHYDVVHLRGGSKRWAGGTVPLKSLDISIHKRWPTQQAYLEHLWRQYKLSLIRRGIKPLFLLSDRTELAQAWIERYGCGTLLPSIAGTLIRESGTHKLRPEELGTLSKEELNYELLRDFTVMLNARMVVGDGMSLFSKMATKCHASGVRLVSL